MPPLSPRLPIVAFVRGVCRDEVGRLSDDKSGSAPLASTLPPLPICLYATSTPHACLHSPHAHFQAAVARAKANKPLPVLSPVRKISMFLGLPPSEEQLQKSDADPAGASPTTNQAAMARAKANKPLPVLQSPVRKISTFLGVPPSEEQELNENEQKAQKALESRPRLKLGGFGVLACGRAFKRNVRNVSQRALQIVVVPEGEDGAWEQPTGDEPEEVVSSMLYMRGWGFYWRASTRPSPRLYPV